VVCHVISQRELHIKQRVINKKYENTRPTGRPKILEVLGNITAEEANRSAINHNLSLPSTLKCKSGREEKEEWRGST
jgi:hypothetical protein